MPDKPPTTARLEAFSDGVIAVIITIMVLELKVPRPEGRAGLYAVLPALFVYFISYAFTGIYWINHRHIIDRIEAADPFTLYANLIFLFCLSLLPFFTAWVLEKKIAAFATALYAVSMFVIGAAFLLLRVAVHRALRRAGDLRLEDKAAHRRHLASLVVFLIAVPVAFYHSYVALAIIAAVTLLWIIPSFAMPKRLQ